MTKGMMQSGWFEQRGRQEEVRTHHLDTTFFGIPKSYPLPRTRTVANKGWRNNGFPFAKKILSVSKDLCKAIPSS